MSLAERKKNVPGSELHWNAKPWTVAALKIIREEGPVRADDVIVRVTPLIPPTRAIRSAENARKWGWKKARKAGRPALREEAARVRKPDNDELVRTGARLMMNNVLWGLARNGGPYGDARIVVFWHEGERWLRAVEQPPK